MSKKPLDNNEFFTEAAAEMLNIGMGAAAASLSEMVEREVLLSTPGVEFVSKRDALVIITKNSGSPVSGVSQKFEGAYTGDAILLFPEQASLELVKALLDQNDTETVENLSEMEQEAITEVGNVILNACLCSIADMLEKSLESSIPEFVHGSMEKILFPNNGVDTDDTLVLLLKMGFSIEQLSVQGYVSFMMNVNSMAEFKVSIEKYLGI